MESDPKPPKPCFREGMANLFAFPRRNTRVDLKEFIIAVLLWGPVFAVLAAIMASAFTVELHVIAIYAAVGFLSFVMTEGLASYFTMNFFWGQLIAGVLFFVALSVTYIVIGSTL